MAPIGTPGSPLDPGLQAWRARDDVGGVTFVPVPASSTPPPVAPVGPVPAPAVTGPEPAGPEPAGPAIAVSGQALAVTPGQALAARIVAIEAGMVQLSLAGGLVTAASDLPLEPGQTLHLVVAEAGQERVTLRLDPGASGGAGAGAAGAGARAGGPAAALAEAGVPPAASSALLAALAEQGAEIPTGAGATALAARAASAGVQTPAQAAAFARLLTAGLPTTPAAVAGLAQLIDGAPLGRALATVIEAAASRAAAPAPAAGSAPATTLPAAAPADAEAPQSAPAAAQAGPRATPPSTASPAAVLPGEVAELPSAAPSANWTNGRGPIGPVATTPAGPAPSAAAAPPLAGLVEALATLAHEIETGAVDGRGPALRHALAELGMGLEARLAGGSAPEHAPLRALLLRLADHPAADAPLARAAAGLADAITAQSLAGPALASPAAGTAAATATPSAPPADTTQSGAYLQVPLPGGGTAEVRISPDAGHDGPGDAERPRRLAFLLHLSALGPVMIDASAGAGGVDATIRVGSDDVRAFLDTQAADLAESLRRSTPTASVRVERMPGPAPERLLAPPPSSGLDVSA